ncbi:MAG: hypothetical protein KDD63_05850, partial [Bacteroidetes bacterium]|nr:hypothetical protein [Bacteroidota bacterium]
TITGYTDSENSSPQKSRSGLRKMLKSRGLPRQDRTEILQMVSNEISLSRRIARLQTMQKLFKYWHVAHLPFALVMLIIVILHIGVTLAFGYKWIF